MDATARPIGVGLKENLFEHFPEALRPKKALVVGGLGARLFLHSDPYAWIGTYFLYEGRKVWTFLLLDAAESAEMLERVKPVDAFGTPIAAGRVSDIDLYHRIVESNPGCALNRRWVSHLGGSGRNDDLSLFGSSHDLSEAAVERALQIVQEEGDLVITPQN